MIERIYLEDLEYGKVYEFNSEEALEQFIHLNFFNRLNYSLKIKTIRK